MALIKAKIDIYSISEKSHISADGNGKLNYTNPGVRANARYKKIVIHYNGKTIISSDNIFPYEELFKYYIDEYNKGNILTEILVDRIETITYNYIIYKPIG